MIIINSKHIIFKNIAIALYTHLREKGLKCVYSEQVDDSTSGDYLYIFIGLNKLIKKYPPKYIIYQFEQIDSYYINDQNEKEFNYFFNKDYFEILKNAYQVWDYSIININYLKNKMNLNNIIQVPICFCHLLKNNINMSTSKDIDVLFYGSLNPKRKRILQELSKENINLVIQNNNCWEQDLDNLISRSKIILNIHFYENCSLEMHRLSYLLTNQSFIISEITNEKSLIDQLSPGIIFSSYDQLVETIQSWLQKDSQHRDKIAYQGFKIFKQQSFESYLNSEIYLYPKEIKDSSKSKKCKSNKKKRNQINWYIPDDIQEAETHQDILNNHFILKLPNISDSDLPYISIITPTRNRQQLFCIAINNFMDFIYPREKIEWVIVDDGNEDLSLMLNFDSHKNTIKYIRMSTQTPIPMGQKRNLCVQNCSHDLIISMDDDDYYPPESIISRVKCLIKYPNIGCVGCNQIGCYDLVNQTSSLASDGQHFFSEASMGFRRSFWEQRPFFDSDQRGEGKYFLQYRQQELLNIPFQFVITAINHHSNLSEEIRKTNPKNNVNTNNNQTDLFNLFNEETQMFFTSLRQQIIKS